MALKKCKECGGEVSSAAKACPKCGAPTLGTALQNVGCSLMLIPFFIIGVIVLILVLVSIF
jgi:predicted amidophosphoribosyltransferase